MINTKLLLKNAPGKGSNPLFLAVFVNDLGFLRRFLQNYFQLCKGSNPLFFEILLIQNFILLIL